MEVDFLILADGAHVAGDKLYVLGGGWSVVWAKEFPATHRGAIAVGMMVGWQETNQRHTIEVPLLSEDGTQIGDPLVVGDFEVGRPPGVKSGTAQRFMVAGTVDFRLEAPGGYEVVVRIDGTDTKRAPFTAVKTSS